MCQTHSNTTHKQWPQVSPPQLTESVTWGQCKQAISSVNNKAVQNQFQGGWNKQRREEREEASREEDKNQVSNPPYLDLTLMNDRKTLAICACEDVIAAAAGPPGELPR